MSMNARIHKRRMGLVSIICLSGPLMHSAKAQVQPKDFNVTDGKIEKVAGNHLMVSTKELRATLKLQTQQNVTMKFTYLGPAKEVAHLGSGEVRSQFGIKLRAQDTCNIVYIMWHFAPDQKIAISVKRNPGQRTHEDCLDHGYINHIKPEVTATPRSVVLVPRGLRHCHVATPGTRLLAVYSPGHLIPHDFSGNV